MTEFISTLSSFNTLVNTLRDNQVVLNRVGQQVSTGKNAPNLADILQRAQVLDLREAKTQTDAYANAISIAQPKADAIDSSITRIINSVNAAIQAIDQFNPSSPAPNLGFIATTITNTTNEVASSLNIRVGNAYVFGGGRYGTAPVSASKMTLTGAQLAAAPYNAAPPASITALGTASTVTAGGGAAYPVVSTAAAPHVVADYDASFTGYTANDDPNNLAFNKAGVTVEDQRRVTYGLTANDSVFQDLVTSLRAAQNGATSGQAAPIPANWLQLARTGLKNAVTTLQAQQAALGQQRQDFKQTSDRHKIDVSNLEINLSKITDIDLAKASTGLLSIQSQYQSSLTVTKTVLGLSLINFLR